MLLDNFAKWFVAENFYIMMGRFLLMGLVWWFGIRLSRKLNSPAIWGLTWIWGLLCNATAIIIICRCDHIGIGFASLIVALFSILALGIYFAMMGATIFYSFFNNQVSSPQESSNNASS